jgi:uncharacterized membrane protein
MSKIEDFLTKEEEQEIVTAIGIAEKNTSGEIRVHIEKETSIPTLERAVEVFHHLHMEQTQERNGVIIYVAVKSKQFAIYGDKGINEKVPTNFWDSTKDTIISHFKNGNFKHGLIDGILKAGEQLKTHFPYQDADTNELSNEISKG